MAAARQLPIALGRGRFLPLRQRRRDAHAAGSGRLHGVRHRQRVVPSQREQQCVIVAQAHLNVRDIAPGTIAVQALSAGDVEIPLVTQLTGAVQLTCNGSGSKLNLADLATYTGGTVTDGGGTAPGPCPCWQAV